MQSKIFTFLTLLIVIVGIASFTNSVSGRLPADEKANQARVSTDAGSSTARAFAWSMATADTYPDPSLPEYTIPMTQLTLTDGQITKEVGLFEGSCVAVDMSEESVARLDIPEGAVSMVSCWHAGGGVDIALFRDSARSDSYLVKRSYVDEGTAEESGIKTEFETLFEI